MKSALIRPRALLCLALIFGYAAARTAGAPAPPAAAPVPAVFNVRAFGAAGDGVTKDTAALQKALDTCARSGGGTVLVPPGEYLTGSLVLGPRTTLRLARRANLCGSPDLADYPLVRVRWEGEFSTGHRALISAAKAGHIAILGPGSIFGPPLALSRLRHPRGPALIELDGCENVTLDGFSTLYQQLWSIHPVFCEKLALRNLTIRTLNYNGDGIDVDSCRDVLIERCDIDTGDDAISLKSGRGLEAVRLGRPTENVVIRDCTLVSSLFAGIGIGSEISGGVRHVLIENCRIAGRQNGILIKSRAGRGGFIEDISGENLTVTGSPTFLAIQLLDKGIPAGEPVTGAAAQWTKVSNLSFRHISVNRVARLVFAREIPAARPVDGLTLTDITGACGRGLTLANMENVSLTGIRVTGFAGPLITVENVAGGIPGGPQPSVSKN